MLMVRQSCSISSILLVKKNSPLYVIHTCVLVTVSSSFTLSILPHHSTTVSTSASRFLGLRRRTLYQSFSLVTNATLRRGTSRPKKVRTEPENSTALSSNHPPKKTSTSLKFSQLSWRKWRRTRLRMVLRRRRRRAAVASEIRHSLFIYSCWLQLYCSFPTLLTTWAAASSTATSTIHLLGEHLNSI